MGDALSECGMVADLHRWSFENYGYAKFVEGMAAGMQVARDSVFKNGSDAGIIDELIKVQKKKSADLMAEHVKIFCTPEGIEETKSLWRQARAKSDAERVKNAERHA